MVVSLHVLGFFGGVVIFLFVCSVFFLKKSNTFKIVQSYLSLQHVREKISIPIVAGCPVWYN